MNFKRSSRRKFLKNGAALVGMAAGALGTASAQSAQHDDHEGGGPELPKGIIPSTGLRPLGVSSPYEKSARTGTAGEGMTPLQDLHGIITPNELHFYVNHEYGFIPSLDPKEYRLVIHGMVDRPLVFTLDELKRLPSVSRIQFLECHGNGNLMTVSAGKTVQAVAGRTSCAEWTGVSLSMLLKEAGVRKDATWVLATSYDTAGHASTLPMEKAMDDIILAYAQNGEAVRLENGYPVRMVVPGWGGRVHVKWLNRIKAVDQPYYTTQDRAAQMPHGGAGEGAYLPFSAKGRAWQNEVYVKSVITYPSGGHRLQGPGFYEISGLAWSGSGKVRKVEVSTDGGRTWKDAPLQEPIVSKAHTRFRLPWNWNGEETILQSRATDEAGEIQPPIGEMEKMWGSDENKACTNVLGEDCEKIRRRANRAYIYSWRVAKDGSVHNGIKFNPEVMKFG